jgi:hypothetical protein
MVKDVTRPRLDGIGPLAVPQLAKSVGLVLAFDERQMEGHQRFHQAEGVGHAFLREDPFVRPKDGDKNPGFEDLLEDLLGFGHAFTGQPVQVFHQQNRPRLNPARPDAIQEGGQRPGVFVPAPEGGHPQVTKFHVRQLVAVAADPGFPVIDLTT